MLPEILSEEIKDAARKIGQFYLEKNYRDFKAAEIEINRTRITKLEVLDNIITIYTERPGILIGVRGENISALEKFLNAKLRIIEEIDVLSYYLIP